MKERRKYIRIAESLIVGYRLLKELRGVTTSSKDISEGGMRMPILHKIKAGFFLELDIYLSEHSKPIMAVGEIIWVNEKKGQKFPFEAGIKFTKINPTALGKLRCYIRRVCEEKNLTNIGWIEEQ